MEDPTGGMWIYLIFLLIPLARIIPRLLRKYRGKNLHEPEPEEQPPERKFFRERMPDPPRFRPEPPKEPEPQEEKKRRMDEQRRFQVKQKHEIIQEISMRQMREKIFPARRSYAS